MENNFKFHEIDKREGFTFGKDITSNRFCIICEKDTMNNQEPIYYENMTYFSLIKIEDKYYELIMFKSEIHELLANKIFDTICSIDNASIIKNISKINSIFNELFKSIDIKILRGIFAEMKGILDFELTPYKDENSIFDCKNNEGCDVEIKSFSSSLREVIISKQQLLNNSLAKFLMVEVIESSDGETIKKVYSNMVGITKEKFKYINSINMDLEHYKFKIVSTIWTEASILSEGLIMPIRSKNAKFVFDIDQFQNKNK